MSSRPLELSFLQGFLAARRSSGFVICLRTFLRATQGTGLVVSHRQNVAKQARQHTKGSGPNQDLLDVLGRAEQDLLGCLHPRQHLLAAGAGARDRDTRLAVLADDLPGPRVGSVGHHGIGVEPCHLRQVGQRLGVSGRLVAFVGRALLGDGRAWHACNNGIEPVLKTQTNKHAHSTRTIAVYKKAGFRNDWS